MITAVDHIVLEVLELHSAVRTFESLGFRVTLAQGSDGKRSAAYLSFDDFYLELRTVASPDAASGPSREGLKEIALRSDDLQGEVARLRSAGISLSEVTEDAIDGPGGSLVRRGVTVDLFTSVRFVENLHQAEARSQYFGEGSHPNTARVLERVYLAVESIDRDLPAFEGLLDMTAPQPEMGTVIMSLMSVFYIGPIGLAISEPRGPGPTADALATNGPGLFQVLFRAEHLDEAAGVMTDNGVPEPERGTRLSGEKALLVRPPSACGAFVALAGPA